jgi:hypothetical protein
MKITLIELTKQDLRKLGLPNAEALMKVDPDYRDLILSAAYKRLRRHLAQMARDPARPMVVVEAA